MSETPLSFSLPRQLLSVLVCEHAARYVYLNTELLHTDHKVVTGGTWCLIQQRMLLCAVQLRRRNFSDVDCIFQVHRAGQTRQVQLIR